MLQLPVWLVQLVAWCGTEQQVGPAKLVIVGAPRERANHYHDNRYIGSARVISR